MFGTTGRYSVEFRHESPGTWERHQMLNSDDLDTAMVGYTACVAAMPRVALTSDLLGIRLIDHESKETMGEWERAA